MKTLTQESEPQVLTDAVRMLKSQFVDLYVQMGYDRKEVSLSWHNLRTSSKGHELFNKLKQAGAPQGQALTFISDVKEEAEIRTKKVKNAKSKNSDIMINASMKVVDAVVAQYGSKEEKAKFLIDSGITRASVLAKEGVFSVPYAYMMLKKYKKEGEVSPSK